MAGPPLSDEIAYQMMHKDDSRVPTVIASGVSMAVIASAAVALRLASRRLSRVKLGADDWCVVASLVSIIVFITVSCLATNYGLGRHFALVPSIKDYLVVALISAPLYPLTICIIKISILLLYKRIFPQVWFRRTVMVTGVFIVVSSIPQIFISFLACVPIRAFWESDTPRTCINLEASFIVGAVINVVTDVFILILPLPVLWHLKASRSRRILLIAMFSMGGLVCIVSGIRIYFVRKPMVTDSSWDSVEGVTFSMIECGFAVLSACLPTYRPIYNYCRFGNATHVSTNKSHSTMQLASVSRPRTAHSTSPNRDQEPLHEGTDAWDTLPISNADKKFLRKSKHVEIADKEYWDGAVHSDVENQISRSNRTPRALYELRDGSPVP